jgi:hypothetical protein
LNAIILGLQLRHDILSAHFAGLRIPKLNETVDPGIERTSRMEAEAGRKHSFGEQVSAPLPDRLLSGDGFSFWHL